MTDNEKPKKPESKKPEQKKLVAKKDFLILHNGYKRSIKVGDDLKDVPELYHQNLKTEGVID